MGIYHGRFLMEFLYSPSVFPLVFLPLPELPEKRNNVIMPWRDAAETVQSKLVSQCWGLCGMKGAEMGWCLAGSVSMLQRFTRGSVQTCVLTCA